MPSAERVTVAEARRELEEFRRELIAESRRFRADGARMLEEIEARGQGHRLPSDPDLALKAAALFASYHPVDVLDSKPEHLDDCVEEATTSYHEFRWEVGMWERQLRPLAFADV